MKFGVRECAEVILRAKARQQIGKRTFYRNEPVIRFDTLNTSSMEGAATTVYAQGGRGNARLLAWEGERTLTFTMEDALISPEGIMILSGAGLIEANDGTDGKPVQDIYVHTTSQVEVKEANKVILPKLACWSHSGEMLASVTPAIGTEGTMPGKDYYNDGADIFIMVLTNGEMASEPAIPDENGVKYFKDSEGEKTELTCTGLVPGSIVLVDYYVKRNSGVKQIEITPDKFGGYFYLEASTLFRDEATGRDLPAEFIIPKCKVQSNFTFTMAASGDPSTFTFTLDAFPDYTKFDGTKKVLAVIQVVESEDDEAEAIEDRRGHTGAPSIAAEADTKDHIHFQSYAEKGYYEDDYAYSDDTYASEGEKTPYAITMNVGSNGTAKAMRHGKEVSTATKNDDITIEAEANTGYELDSIKVNNVEITGTTFEMPDRATTVAVTFKAATQAEQPEGD
jgi:hypothetical protein